MKTIKILLIFFVGLLLTACTKHAHTYQTVWSSNETKHWHEATCEHQELIQDEALHDFGEAVTSKEDCVIIKTTICQTCGYKQVTNTGVIEHEYETSWSIDGEKHFHKASCSHKELIQDEAPHDFGRWQITVLPTCESVGKQVKKCAVCNYEIEEDYPKLNHTFSDEWSYNANCHYHKSTCCDGKVFKDEEQHIIGRDNTCSVCEYKQPVDLDAVTQNLEYVLSPDGKSYWVSGANFMTDHNLVIPRMHNGLFVTGIAPRAFYGNQNIERFKASNVLTTIGDYAFFNCPNLKEIVIDTKVANIGLGAFFECYKLNKFEVIDNEKYIVEDNLLIDTDTLLAVAGFYSNIEENLTDSEKLEYQKLISVIKSCQDIIVNTKIQISDLTLEIRNLQTAYEEVFNYKETIQYKGYKSVLDNAVLLHDESLSEIVSFVKLGIGCEGIVVKDLEVTKTTDPVYGFVTIKFTSSELETTKNAYLNDPKNETIKEKFISLFKSAKGDVFEDEYLAAVEAYIDELGRLAIASKAMESYMSEYVEKSTTLKAQLEGKTALLKEVEASLGLPGKEDELPTLMYKDLEMAQGLLGKFLSNYYGE